ncbi:MAG: hypothetical protein ACI9K1_002622, partial [Arcticibacterium sp.]
MSELKSSFELIIIKNLLKMDNKTSQDLITTK